MDLDSFGSSVSVSWERLAIVSELSLVLAASHPCNASMRERAEHAAEMRPNFAQRDKLLTIS